MKNKLEPNTLKGRQVQIAKWIIEMEGKGLDKQFPNQYADLASRLIDITGKIKNQTNDKDSQNNSRVNYQFH